MADPTLAEMVERLRGRVGSGIVDALAEIDRRLTALEGRRAPALLSTEEHAARLRPTMQALVDELAAKFAPGLPPPRVVWPSLQRACPGSATAVQGSEGRASCPSCRQVWERAPRSDGLYEIPEHER